MNADLLGLPAYPMAELSRRRAAIAARGLPVFDFGTCDPREPTAAFIRTALLGAVPEVSQYPSVAGPRELREAFARYFARRFGVALDPDTEVLPSGGSKEAIFHLPMTFLDPSSPRRVVVYGEPAYPVFEIGTLFAGGERHAVRLDAANDHLLLPEQVGDDVLARTAVVFLNYPHNPTGRTMPRDGFESWQAARERCGFLLVSDECYCDLYYGEPPHSLLETGREGCLAVHSLSKRSGMTGYRSGMLAGDAGAIARFRRFRDGMGVASPVWTQAAARAAWSDDRHVAERRAVFARKRGVLVAALERRGLAVCRADAGLFLWVEVPAGDDGVGYSNRLDEVGIVIAPGAYFGAGLERFVRLALVPTVAECERAAELWP